ncbi:c-type cytochrome biogenesis protein CcmI [Vibrio sp. DW001]|uniref:c-type cytochrome biogenesis protein CcmI n=1 Tax=Vibrio sp. DW001 TaxID=2912315 RepID=UPI0023B0DED1|nr:c-type cytochrome biogenesis protein CcmI [Vibrio sp. DW001]WED25847.1 c-type cytochrome biogenesis protein CcmI [Vibrio sp. DW001]
MAIFWLSTVVLILAAIVFIALPLFRKQRFDDEARRDELNKAFYKDRLEELEVEAEAGVVTDQEDLIVDLKQLLLEDIPVDENKAKSFSISPMAVFIPSALVLVVISYAVYSIFGSLDKVSHWQNINDQLPVLTQKLMSPEQESLTEDELKDLKLALRTRLHYQPDDAQGWLLLGRIALADRDADTATGAMKKAHKLDADDPDVRLGYAQSLMMSEDERQQQLARSILIGLLQDDYVDLRVYSLLAFNAYQRGEYEESIRFWRTMQKLIGPDDNRYSMLDRSIENAEKMLGKAVTTSSVPITITVGQDIQLPEQGLLIVSIHDGNGSPVPVAAARYPIGTFPRTIVLDDANVMMEGQSITQLESLLVKARIDTDGNVSTKEGDWYGESQVMKMGDQVAIMIDKQY